MMNNKKLFLLAMMIVPWLSVPFLGKRELRRFLPGALFICVWVTVESILAKKWMWWRFYEKLTPKVMGEIPFIVGPFFIGSLWILKFTFGKFFRYLIVNIVTDVLFAYPGVYFLKRFGIVSLVRLKHYQMVLLFITKSVLMYGIQSLAMLRQKKAKSFFKRIFS